MPGMTEISVTHKRERRSDAASVPATNRYFGQNQHEQHIMPGVTEIANLP